ncbi:precorrin-2 dehydrogenase/sirohydrochlorin ferrochelatase family protein [Neomoorella thermoacetica]|uniref:precorrin-2 dehydrogenase n=1 Tax=Moorella thermoacetica (strain ATCC 39073 / JCM 9320) TaxID=264732 RepID=Q2RJ24_MOOTA|nr:bifunctional precorrin-2 dehydrogenase/sirohydrochlorin ferrochelatase [Moorella thermoacetica]AKX94026.1 siroheme synthase [Moorella thermoacetica]AKX96665.1 siroheme synthase [Moorella thermoacetica]OIQ56394.1 siroheme synthase [Moorella thermoacetica]OIQ57835.1 siroheme synthase [Moorella thermoacetica]QDA00479.1 Siroheme synthase [Moorella thermoacetica]
MGFYPLVIDLTDRPCLVIGGGTVSERKVLNLLEAGARITLVSPVVTRTLADLALASQVVWWRREYREGDLKGMTMVFAATNDPELNARIAVACHQAGILVNVVDNQELCTFNVPAVVRRGDLQIAISTAGKSPALARQLRKQLEAEIGPEYGPWVDFLGEIRPLLKSVWPNDQKRREELLRRLAGDEILFRLVARGKEELAKERVKQCLSLPPV